MDAGIFWPLSHGKTCSQMASGRNPPSQDERTHQRTIQEGQKSEKPKRKIGNIRKKYYKSLDK